MSSRYDYYVGVDGGGTKTLVRVVHADGTVLGEATGPGAQLSLGAANAWDSIVSTLQQVFEHSGKALPPLSQLAMGIGIAGFNVAQQAADFRALAPAFGALRIASDGTTTLLGAHQGQAGTVIAVGTGTIGIALYADGSEKVVDAWGFPSGDDASGAWMGLRAMNHTQRVVDGRAAPGALSAAVLAYCASDSKNASDADARSSAEIVLDWLSQARQAAFARLAKLVVTHAHEDEAARRILVQAGEDIALMAKALDPSGQLPLALCGGLAGVLTAYFPPELQQRAKAAQGDSADGALLMVRQAL